MVWSHVSMNFLPTSVHGQLASSFSLLVALEPPAKAHGASRPSTSNIVGSPLGYNHQRREGLL